MYPAVRVGALLVTLLGCSSSGGARPMPVGPGEDTGGATGGSPQGGSGGAAVSEDAAPAADVRGPAAEDAGLTVDEATAADEGRPIADGPVDSALHADRAATPDTPPAVGYDPCPPKGKPCVVLPLGDSLTQGAFSSTGGGYRLEVFRQALAHKQALTFVGSGASGPAMVDGVPFPRNHEGHGGFSIQALATWLTDHQTIATYRPDVVLLHIGTNNGLRHPGPDIPAVLSALGAMIDQLVASDPHVLVIVAQIIPSKSDDGVKNTEAYNAGIPAVVAARAAAGKHVIIADVHSFFVADPNWKVDYLPTSDVHPIDPGYQAMGRGWYSVLGPLLR